MTRKRDLSGFGLNPPPAPDAVPAPPRERRERQVEPPTRRRSLDKRRITLSLPTAVAGRLRRAAEQTERFYLELILEAFVDFADAIDRDLTDSGPPPKRRAAGRTQIPLNILSEDLAVLDERATKLRLDRSSYVAELLTRSLG